MLIGQKTNASARSAGLALMMAASVALAACGEKPKPPIGGGDSGCKNGPFTRRYAEQPPTPHNEAWRALLGKADPAELRDGRSRLLAYGEGEGPAPIPCP